MRPFSNIKKIIDRKSFIDFLIAMNNTKDYKEMSEVGGMYKTIESILSQEVCTGLSEDNNFKMDFRFKPDFIIDIGCGKRPTLGTIMALNYKYPVICVDPQLSGEYAKNITGMEMHKCTLKEWWIQVKDDEKYKDKKYLLLANHSHVTKKEIKLITEQLASLWIYITCPCCVDNLLSNRKAIAYKDNNIWSDKNIIYTFYGD
jgi:hypothetical protein